MPLTAHDQDDRPDTFVYDADAKTLTRASIGADGPAGARGNGPFDARLGTENITNAHPNITDDGAVFFQTDEALVVADRNSVQDVYEFDHGRVALISGGRGEADLPSFYVDNSGDGRDAFFLTADGLDPRDSDRGWDIYDARVGGGFPQPPPPCAALVDACQAASAPPPAVRHPGSASLVAPPPRVGDDCQRLEQRHEKAKKKSKGAKKKSKRAKKKSKRAKKKSKRASGKMAKRLDERADKQHKKARKQHKKARKQHKKAKKQHKRAKAAKVQAKQCKRGAK